MKADSQTVPVRMYRSQERIMVAAPMPGLNPEDISITISVQRLTIRGESRGPGQRGLDLLVDEWTTGPYYREISLPETVNGRLSNATYGNGVLVLSMPVIKTGESSIETNFQLRSIDATRGEHVGHSGKDIHPTTTEEHIKKHHKSGNPYGVRSGKS